MRRMWRRNAQQATLWVLEMNWQLLLLFWIVALNSVFLFLLNFVFGYLMGSNGANARCVDVKDKATCLPEEAEVHKHGWMGWREDFGNYFKSVKLTAKALSGHQDYFPSCYQQKKKKKEERLFTQVRCLLGQSFIAKTCHRKTINATSHWKRHKDHLKPPCKTLKHTDKVLW